MPASVYKVAGTARPAISTSKGPGALSLAEKTDLLKAIGLPGPGTVYVTLSPSRPEVTNHAGARVRAPARYWTAGRATPRGECGILTQRQRTLLSCSIKRERESSDLESGSSLRPQAVDT